MEPWPLLPSYMSNDKISSAFIASYKLSDLYTNLIPNENYIYTNLIPFKNYVPHLLGK